MKNDLKMLNPELLSDKQKTEIKEKFMLLKSRNILPILAELESEDRKEFDNAVLNAFNIKEYKDQIEESLRILYEIRMNVRS